MEKIWLDNYTEEMPKLINPDQYASIIHMFDEYCEKFAFKTAFSNFGVSLSYQQLANYSHSFAAALQKDLKIKKGDRLAIMLPNCLQYPVVLFAALRLGVIVVNVNPLYTERELLGQLKDSEAESIVILKNFVPVLAQVLDQTSVKNVIVTEIGDLFPFFKSILFNYISRFKQKKKAEIPNSLSFSTVLNRGMVQQLTKVSLKGEDIAFLQYTGGTTGVSKGAILTHKNIVANILQCIGFVNEVLEEGKEIVVTALPLYHIFSLTICCFVFLKLGATSLLITNPRDIPMMTKTLKKHPFSVFVGVNTLFLALLRSPSFRRINFRHLKFNFAGGMAVTHEVAEQWKALTGKHITLGYGLTEASPVVTINPLYIDKFTASIGIPVASTEVKFVDENENEVGIEEKGELCVKGPQVMQGYWQNEDETKLVLSEDGWLKTGDIAYMDKKGFIFLVDRKKDMILVSGFNVYPNEVEEIIAAHEGVEQVAVIGVKDQHSGEVVKAFIVKKNPDLTKEDILEYCRHYLTGYKLPRQIEFRDELPKSNIGKVLRQKLREENE